MAIRINGKDYDTTINKNTHNTKISNVGQVVGYEETKPGLGTYHMANASNLYEIQRGNNFEFVVVFGEEPLIRAGLTTPDDWTKTPGEAQEILRMSVSEAFIPHFTQNAVEVKRGNTTIKYAGTPEFQGGELTFNDFIGADTKSILMAWQNLSYNVATEKVGLASDYKKEALLIEYTPDLQKVRQWHLYGCWISALSESSYSSENSDKHQVSCTITYDKAILEPFNVE